MFNHKGICDGPNCFASLSGLRAVWRLAGTSRRFCNRLCHDAFKQQRAERGAAMIRGGRPRRVLEGR